MKNLFQNSKSYDLNTWITYRNPNPLGSDNGGWFCFMRADGIYGCEFIPDSKTETDQNLAMWERELYIFYNELSVCLLCKE